ncbi:two-component response regulator [Flammeovirgaceae bacterium 311]|nr:two-component response regulator [Flammeovirgaceae bacterium 311]
MKKLNSILLVDDDAICSWINRVMLEEMKVAQTVACINDGKSAIEYLQNGCCNPDATPNACPDLIFLDLNMPGVDGFEVLEKLRETKGCESFSAEKIVVLTTSMHQKDLEKANNYNVYGYLIKPLTEAKINGILEGFMERLQQKNSEQKEKPNNTLPPDRHSTDRPAGAVNPLKENKLK